MGVESQQPGLRSIFNVPRKLPRPVVRHSRRPEAAERGAPVAQKPKAGPRKVGAPATHDRPGKPSGDRNLAFPHRTFLEESVRIREASAMPDSSNPIDPFREARQKDGVLTCPFQGEALPMILRHSDVRAAAKDWQTFSSDAPFRVPIPSEEEVRTMRQLPIETNPPEHTEYRKIVEPFFQRSKTPGVIAQVEALIDAKLSAALNGESIEIVNDFALPIQSHALTYLLNVPETEAETYISWGIHVFKVDGVLAKTGSVLEEYLRAQFDKAEVNPGEDFFSALTKAEFRGRKLTREEMMGFGNLTFAGGRDTIIHSISSIIGYFGENPEALEFLREDPKRIVHAGEEFFRVFMPLTHIGRVCPAETDVLGVKVPPDGRVSLGWASANFDEAVFDKPEEIQLDRKPNPHISFGFGAHLCLGAPHARMIVRTLLQALVDRVDKIDIVGAKRHVEHEARYDRPNGYDSLTVKLGA
jgi:cytochrome P450